MGETVGHSQSNTSGTHSFFRSADGSVFSTIDVPSSLIGSTFASGINNNGQIVGTFNDACCRHGFLRSADGSSFMTLDGPVGFRFGATGFASDINDSGDIVGQLEDANGDRHGFLRTADGNFTIIDHPDAIDTIAFGINNKRQIVGQFLNATGYHGFVATPVSPGYTICLFYDPTRAVRSGSTLPIKLQLCDANNQNLSSASIVLHAISIEMLSSAGATDVQHSGNANPDNNFRYDASIGDTGGYIFNLKTRGLHSGSCALNFTVADGFTIYQVPFQVR
jgi:probable HAF family extracellular repeat protein